MTIDEAKKLLPPELKYPLPDGVIDNLINVQAIPLQFNFDEDGTGNGMHYAMMAALIELKERRKRGEDDRIELTHLMGKKLDKPIIMKWKSETKKNKMHQVAAMFGKQLGEQFYIKIHNKKYIARFTVFGLSVLDESANPCEWDLGHSRLLECLMIGEAVIINE